MWIVNELSSAVGSPHHLVSKCVKEYMVRPFYYLYIIIGLADDKASSFAASLAPAVDGHQEVVASAFHIQRDFPIVVDDNWADVEAVRSDGRDGDGVAMWYDNWPSDT